MELKLSDGEYTLDAFGELREARTKTEALIERVMLRLRARRGAFPLLPEVGSRLYALGGMKKAERQTAARQYVGEALRTETEVSVAEVAVTEPEPGEIKVSLELTVPGGSVTLSVNV